MLVREWMKSPVRTVKPLEPLAHARRLLEEHRINQLPVVVRGRVTGIVTDRDLRDAFPSSLDPRGRERRRGGRKTESTAETPVERIMSRTVITVAPDDSIEHAAITMRRERIGALPVVDGTRLVGILARSDVLEAFATVAAELRAPRPQPGRPPRHASEEIGKNW